MTCWRRANPTRSKAIHDKEYAKKREEYEEKRASTVKACAQCGKEFTPGKLVRQMYCSKKCRNKHAHLHQSKICNVDSCDRPCRCLGMCAMHYARYRAENGLVRKHRPTPEQQVNRRAHEQKRRARKKGAFVEFVDNLTVFERDDWVCGICGEPVDPNLQWPDPMSATLDHIVPLSRGGAHSYQNVQCAHFRCNCSKGNRVA